VHFSILQAIGDGGQGWGNAILYVFFSPEIRRRLFGEPFDKCLLAAENKFQELLETETETSKSVQSGKVQSERVSLVISENTVTNGRPATGYGVRNYQGDSSSTGTSKTASQSVTTKSLRGTPMVASATTNALSRSANVP
jgi:hypothetical protein